MYYSLTLTNDRGETKNTWDDFYLIPTKRPLVNPPSVKEEYVDIPGANGSLDFTEALSGAIHYGMREGSWEFIVDSDRYSEAPQYIKNINKKSTAENPKYPYEDSQVYNSELGYYTMNEATPVNDWWRIYSELMQFLHGRKMTRIKLESDNPNIMYTGRLFVESWDSEKDNSKVVIKYKIDPFSVPDNTTTTEEIDPITGDPISVTYSQREDWKWSGLYGNYQIIHEKFAIPTKSEDGEFGSYLYRTFYNPTENESDYIVFQTDIRLIAKVGVVVPANGDAPDETNAVSQELLPGVGNDTNNRVRVPRGERVCIKFENPDPAGQGTTVRVFYGSKGAGL